MKCKKHISIELSGGIGNQLFQYAAGIYFAKRLNSEVLFKLFGNTAKQKKTKNALLEFSLNSTLIENKRPMPNLSYQIGRVRRKIANNSNFYRMFRYHTFGDYQSNSIGFTGELTTLSKIRSLKGYFQTYKYADAVKVELEQELRLKNPSITYEKYLIIAKETCPIMMHIRGTDYKENIRTIGMLDKNYYENALLKVKEFGLRNKLWVFSDDEIYTNKLMKQLKILPDKVFFPNSGLSDTETLKLMSVGYGIIISNSTFSWWAAYLNKNCRFIICPDKWFKGMEDPYLLLPEHWIKVQTSWLQYK